MANIKLNNNEYPIPESKLAPAKADLIAHLGTIAGNGLKVVIGGVEYNVDFSKISSVVSGLEAVLGELNVGGGDVSLAPGLYQTGAIALYEEQGVEAVEGMMVKSWDELVESGAIVVDNGTVSVGITTVSNLPEKNEYGFYYDTTYSAFSNGSIATIIFHNDGSFDMYTNGVLMQSTPAGSAIYSNRTIDLSAVNWGVGTISEDSTSIDLSGSLGMIFNLGGCINLEGDLILSKDAGITAIANNAFTGRPLTNVIIPDGVVSIGYGAFYNCTNLTNVTIPDSVTNIGEGAFNSCTSLTSVIIGDGVTTIGNYAFQGCEVLSSVIIPGSVKTIGYEAFGRCEGLTNVTIAEGVECIGEYAFGYSFMGTTPGTSAVYLPSTITEIQRRAFAQSKLTDVYYNGTCDQFRAINRATDAFYYTDKVVIHCTDGDYDWT